MTGIVPRPAVPGCPSCGGAMAAVDARHGTCASCRTVRRLPPGAVPVPPGPDVASDPLGRRPEFLDLDAGRVRVTFRWVGSNGFGLALFTAAFLGFTLWGAAEAGWPSGPAALPLWAAMALVGGGSAYLTLATFVNRTVVIASPDRVSVRHHPLPWPGNRTLATDRFVRIRVVDTEPPDGETHLEASFDVVADLRSGDRIRLVRHLVDAADALEVAERISVAARIPGDVQG